MEEGWNVAGMEMESVQYKAVSNVMTTYSVVQAQLEAKKAAASAMLMLEEPKGGAGKDESSCTRCGCFPQGSDLCDSCGVKLCPDCDKDGECVECKAKNPASEPSTEPAGAINSSESVPAPAHE